MSIYVAAVPGESEVKIGFTNWPRERLNTLRRLRSADIRFLAIVDGGLQDERRLHDALNLHATAREWFDLNRDPVRAAVDKMVSATDPATLRRVNKPKRRYSMLRCSRAINACLED